MLEIYTDGSCLGNENKKIIYYKSTDNVALYQELNLQYFYVRMCFSLG